MTDFQIYLTLGVFAAVILLIAFDLIDMMVAALIGVSVLIAFGVLDGNDLMPIVHTASGPLALLFGGMVVARVLDKTGVFEWLGEYTLHATGGSGKRLLLIIVALLLPLNAFLPNATVDILVAPVCSYEPETYTCDGSTVEGAEIKAEAVGSEPDTVSITVGGKQIFSGSIDEVLKKASER